MKATRSLLGPSLFPKLMKSTVYGQFAAGEDNESVKEAIKRFRNVGVRSALNYSVEEDEGSVGGGGQQGGERYASVIVSHKMSASRV